MWLSELYETLLVLASALIPKRLRDYDISKLNRFETTMYYVLMVTLKLLVVVLVNAVLLAFLGLIIAITRILL